jgi:outer membrane protein assembly factor BamE (lipoprotein component of BamABCDE complex)
MSVLEKKLKVFYLTSPESRRTASPVVEEKTGDDQVEKLEEIAKQTDSPEMEQLKQRNELLENNVQNLHSRVDQLTSQLEQSSKTTESLTRAVEALLAQQGQPASPEAIQEGTEAGKQQIQEEAINEMKKPESKEKAKSFWTADLGKVFKNAPLWQKALIVLAGGALTGFALTATLSGVVPGVAFLGSQAGFAGLGAPTFLAAGLKGIAAATTALGFTKTVEGALIAGKEAMKSLNPEPNSNTPPLQPVAEQQVQQPQFQEANEGKMEKAKGIVSSLAEVEGEPISYNGSRDGNPIRVDLKYSNDQYTFQTSDQPGYRSNIISENDLADGLARLDNDTLESLQNQIDDIKVRKEQAQQQPKAEEVISPENQERAPESINLDELEAGDSVTLTFDQNGNEQTIKLVKNQDGTVNKFNTYGTKTGENLEVASKTTIENGNVQTITTDPNVISTAPNTVVVISGDYPNGISVKSVTVEKLAAAKPETTAPSTPEATKSPEAISQSAYTKIGENLDKINEAAKKPSVDILKGAWGGYFEGANATALDDQLNKPEFLDKLDGYLDNKPVTEGFSTEPEFDNITLLRTCLAIANLDIPKEVKDSLKSNNLPQAITEFKGNNLVGDLLNFAGPNLEAAKQVLRANKEIEKAKKESEKYDNDNVKAGVVGVELLKSSNQIITSQIPEFKDSNTVWDKNKVIDAIEGDLKTGSTTLSEGKHPVAEQIIELGNSYLKTPEESVAA